MYDKVEPYEVCGEELREAYVGLKRLRHGDVRASLDTAMRMSHLKPVCKVAECDTDVTQLRA